MSMLNASGFISVDMFASIFKGYEESEGIKVSAAFPFLRCASTVHGAAYLCCFVFNTVFRRRS